jgi:hypothetical protein
MSGQERTTGLGKRKYASTSNRITVFRLRCRTNPGKMYSTPLQTHVAYAEIFNSNPTKKYREMKAISSTPGSCTPYCEVGGASHLTEP